jgi:hypothetical protein
MCAQIPAAAQIAVWRTRTGPNSQGAGFSVFMEHNARHTQAPSQRDIAIAGLRNGMKIKGISQAA